jgi:2,3-diketo-5-methylthiopentyl-1-phosphate enolase
MDHPNGPSAGVQAFFQALDRYQQHQSFDINQIPPSSLRQAMEKWG